MKIIPLSEEHLEETIKMANDVFPDDIDEKYSPRKSLSTSIKFKENTELLEKSPMQKLDYWIALDDSTNKVVGVTGLYRRKNEPEDIIWLGWYCVNINERGKGIGRKLLEWTIDKARTEGFKKFKLYTSEDPNEARAQELYEKLDFKVVGKEANEGDCKTLYREKVL
jgi:GNAT superfamily N-acetyltransferase